MTDETRETTPDVSEPAAAGGAPAAAPGPDPEALQRERDEYFDLLLRKTAEFDNYRKRVERERLEREQSAAADLLSALLPLVDDLERALSVDAESSTVESYREGVRLIHEELVSVLETRGVTPIQAVGADFDPNFHEAVATEPSDAHRDGEVVEEVRRGYRLHDRLLRAAMVRVATS